MRGESEVNMDKGPFKQSNVDGEAILVEPVPDPTAGILIVGQVKYLKIMKLITIFSSENLTRNVFSNFLQKKFFSQKFS